MLAQDSIRPALQSLGQGADGPAVLIATGPEIGSRLCGWPADLMLKKVLVASAST
jgi:hypothetical protein